MTFQYGIGMRWIDGSCDVHMRKLYWPLTLQLATCDTVRGGKLLKPSAQRVCYADLVGLCVYVAHCGTVLCARTLCVLCVYFAHEIAWVLSDLVADATSYKLSCGRSDLLRQNFPVLAHVSQATHFRYLV